MCVRRPKTLYVPTGPECEILMGRIHCLYKKLIYRFHAAERPSIYDCREQTLSPDNSQPALIQAQLCTDFTDFHHIRGRFEGNNVRNMELNISLYFTMMEQVLLNVFITQFALFSSSGNINKNF